MRSRKIVVFLGPSLDRERAREILDADYRPPAKRGDVFKAAKEGASIIGLIDGVFFQDSAVAHKEILHVLEMKTKVIGSSSMGALRASELYPYGMEGVGEIYRLYMNGILVSDDEVALIFDPVSFDPLSEPLINIRDNIREAEEKMIIGAGASEKILESALSLYFPDRTYERILEIANLDEDERERFKSFIQKEKGDLKREDAIKALERIKEIRKEITEAV
ncbi:MAG: TfuA-related McrA-glycine thioamidation protein [Euryarchaeota archaeon]|nr:TfuA-related McrA-glycine thioamidation protein [Euryarchaeota archaeon]